jgi:AcrR family transcriptional regulator
MTSQRHNIVEASRDATTRAADRQIPETVLAATRATVLAVGVRRTTLTEVARRAGVSRMTLYRMVPDVTTLVLEVMTQELAELLTHAERAAARRRSTRARVVGTAVEVVRALPENPLFRRVLDVDPELLLPYLTDRLGSTQRIAIAQVRRMLAEGMADGSVRRGDLDLMAACLIHAGTPFIVSSRLFDDVGRDAAIAEFGRMLDGWLRP